MPIQLAGWSLSAEESGTALLVALAALSIFSLLGLFMVLNATAELGISDNGESQLQASYAALSGIHHARALLCGLSFDDLLRGPDGSWDHSASYIVHARTFAFRNPFPWTTAQSLDVNDPASSLGGLQDDGIINAGFYGGACGIALIPLSGIAHVAPSPYGAGTIATSRYFVKASDNNGDASETAGDPDDNPFFDGDGTILLRSIGVARTHSDATGAIRRNNSVVVFEVRMRRLLTFDLGPALVVHGVQAGPTFDGPFEIEGGTFPAIGTIDADPDDAFRLDQTIQAAPSGSGTIHGGNLPAPSVLDISGEISSDPEKSRLLSADFLWSFARSVIPRHADVYCSGNQDWSALNAPYLGFFDASKPPSAPGQDPKIIVVDGSLQLTGSISGGGLLVVTGDFSCTGHFSYNGLVLAIGAGRLHLSGSEVAGGIYLANLNNHGSGVDFGTAEFSISGSSRILANRELVRMALGLLPASQTGFREIAGSDP